MNILLVDDEPSFREIGKIYLEKEGCNVITSDSPNKAFEKLSSDKKIDLIISDFDMPNKDGIEFYEDLKKRGHSGIPFILITGCRIEGLKEKALNKGITKFFKKKGKPKNKFSQIAKESKQLVN